MGAHVYSVYIRANFRSPVYVMKLFSKYSTLGKSTIPEGGTGVFATHKIPQGTVIERCRVLITRFSAPEGDDLWYYVMQSPWDKDESLVCLGNGSMYNHSPSPNTKHVNANRTNKTIDIVAMRDVEKGEELLVDYGTDFWQ